MDVLTRVVCHQRVLPLIQLLIKNEPYVQSRLLTSGLT